jgi:hypothetical protein
MEKMFSSVLLQIGARARLFISFARFYDFEPFMVRELITTRISRVHEKPVHDEVQKEVQALTKTARCGFV